jgi:hypothetical protein
MTERNVPIRSDFPSIEDVRKATLYLKNCKAADQDDCFAEAFKSEIGTSKRLLYPLFQTIWKRRMAL